MTQRSLHNPLHFIIRFFIFFASPIRAQGRGKPPLDLSGPFTPITVTRKPSQEVPGRVRQGTGAEQGRQSAVASPVVQIAKSKPLSGSC